MTAVRPAVVFLSRYPVTSRHRAAWGFDRLEADGFDVVVLDMHPLLAPWAAAPSADEDLGAAEVIPVRSFSELDELIARYAPRAVFMDYIVGLADADARGARVLRTVRRHGGSFYEMAAGDLPHPSQVQDREGRRELWRGRLKKALDLRQLAAYGVRKALLVATRLGGFVPLPARIFGTRSETVLRYFERMKAPPELFVPANAPDYDRYRESLEREGTPEIEDVCVFIDMAMTSHPDIRTLGLPEIDEGRYYRAMNRLFDGVEADTGLKVVVAAHPQARYEEGTFGGRPIVKGSTASLVARSRCIITHASTAVGFAVLWRKPIVFVVTDDMKDAGYHLDVYAMANALCSKPRNADHWTPDRARDDYLSVDESCYTRYEEEFLVSPESRDRSSWDVVAEYAARDLAGRPERPGVAGPGSEPRR